jgi:cation transport regulator ChaB
MPSTVLRSEPHAQDIWRKAHASALKTYGEGGAAPRRVAFAALKHVYEKRGDRWVRKAEKGPSDPQAARGQTTRRKSTDLPAAPTAGGRVARTEAEARREGRTARNEQAGLRRRESAGKAGKTRTGKRPPSRSDSR